MQAHIFTQRQKESGYIGRVKTYVKSSKCQELLHNASGTYLLSNSVKHLLTCSDCEYTRLDNTQCNHKLKESAQYYNLGRSVYN